MLILCFARSADVKKGEFQFNSSVCRRILLRVITLGSQIDGKEWQEYVISLLFIRYATDLIEIPDKDKGDGGLEAYSLTGHAYQCYAPEGLNSVTQLAQKHKDKINRDLNKFKS